MSRIPYNPVDNAGPPSPNPRRNQAYDSLYAASQADITDEHDEPFSPPAGAGLGPPGYIPPRFQGLGPDNGVRNSLASTSQFSLQAPSYRTSDYDSVHGLALNQQPPPSPGPGGHPGNWGSSPLLHAEESYHDDPNHPGGIPLSPVGTGQGYRQYPEKRDVYGSPRQKSQRKVWLIVGGILLLLAIIAGVGIPVYLFVIKPHQGNSSDANGGSSGSGSGGSSGGGSTSGGGGGGKGNNDAVVTGGDGTKITTENGTVFTYTNSFGGGRTRSIHSHFKRMLTTLSRLLVLGCLGSFQ